MKQIRAVNCTDNFTSTQQCRVIRKRTPNSNEPPETVDEQSHDAEFCKTSTTQNQLCRLEDVHADESVRNRCFSSYTTECHRNRVHARKRWLLPQFTPNSIERVVLNIFYTKQAPWYGRHRCTKGDPVSQEHNFSY